MDLLSLIRASNPTKIDEPATATDSSRVPSAIEKSPLDFAHEDGASDKDLLPLRCCCPRMYSLLLPLRDHASLRPSGAPADVSDPDPLSLLMLRHTIPLTLPVAMGSQLSLRFEQEAKLLQKSVAQVARRDQRIQSRELEIKNLEVLRETEVSREETLKAAFEEYKQQQDQLVEQRWYGLLLAMMKCAESLEMRQAFAYVVFAGVAKGMNEGLNHGVEHGHAQLTVESLEAYDPEAEAKFAAALKDLKYPLLDQLEGLKDAPMDVIMAALYLESDTGGMPYNLYATSVPAPLSSPSRCTRRSDSVSVSVPTVVP
nr:hypothetical protein [Tanacetum cinerariifolium]